jgi:uncharacterized lipoprotein YmbA
MNANYFARTAIPILLTTLLLLCGCFGRSPQTKFYLLYSIPSPEATEVVRTEKDLRIGVGPLELSEYLDRPQIVTQTSQSGLRIDQFNQWAETLEGNIARVLARNLSTLLSTENLFLFPWLGSTRLDFQVKLDIIDFKGVPGDKVVLDAQYTILDGDRELLEMKVVNITQPISDHGYEDLVSSMSKALDEFSRTIAQTIMAHQRETAQLK